MATAELDAATQAEILRDAYRDCHAVARSAARNFYYAFLILPKRQRLAMCALYTYLRRTDDIGDGDGSVDRRREALVDWRIKLSEALDGAEPEERWWLALADTVKRFGIPSDHLQQVIDGVESDLVVSRYETFDELYRYCYRVASVVGLSCIRIWEATDPRAELPAEHCGIAFQLTNIIRDIVEDRERGRIYLPGEDLRRFDLEEDQLLDPAARSKVVELIRFQIDRAQRYYDRGEALQEFLPPSGRAVFRVLVDIYRGLLRKIERHPEAVLDRRVRLHPAKKIAALASAWPKRYFAWPAVARSRPV